MCLEFNLTSVGIALSTTISFYLTEICVPNYVLNEYAIHKDVILGETVDVIFVAGIISGFFQLHCIQCRQFRQSINILPPKFFEYILLNKKEVTTKLDTCLAHLTNKRFVMYLADAVVCEHL